MSFIKRVFTVVATLTLITVSQVSYVYSEESTEVELSYETSNEIGDVSDDAEYVVLKKNGDGTYSYVLDDRLFGDRGYVKQSWTAETDKILNQPML